MPLTRAKVHADGAISVPADSAQEAGFAPGDDILIWQAREGNLRILRVEYSTPEQLAERYPITEPIDTKTLREEWEAAAADEVVAEMRRNAARPD